MGHKTVVTTINTQLMTLVFEAAVSLKNAEIAIKKVAAAGNT
jgi:hypothetical protein